MTTLPLTPSLRDASHENPAQHAPSVMENAEPKRTFEAIYKDEFKFIWRNARALGATRSDADDVVQDVFVVVHRRLNEFDGRRPIRSWLLAILIRVLQEHRRRVRRHSNPPTDAALTAETTTNLPEEALLRNQASGLVCAILDTMSDEQRSVFVLCEIDELTAPEVARILEVSENTVYSRLRLARLAFQNGLARVRARNGWRTS